MTRVWGFIIHFSLLARLLLLCFSRSNIFAVRPSLPHHTFSNCSYVDSDSLHPALYRYLAYHRSHIDHTSLEFMAIVFVTMHMIDIA